MASIVSVGRWQQWVLTILPEIKGPRVLELGHGPGHLLVALALRGVRVIGLDESWQMSRQAARKLSSRNLQPALINGYAQYLPLPSASFHQVVATFPSEYIIHPLTLASIFRVLVPGGDLLIVPGAWITGHSLLDRLAAGLFRITGQAPQWSEAFIKPVYQAGFQVDTEIRDLNSSKLIIIRARKPDLNQNQPS